MTVVSHPPLKPLADRETVAPPLRVGWVLALAAVMVLAAVLRLQHLGDRSIWFDEAVTFRVASSTAGEFFDRLRVLENTPPLHFILVGLCIRLFGASEVSLRMPSVIAGVAAVYLIYRFASLLMTRREGLLAALFLACSPMQIVYSREARSYELMVCMALWSCVTYLKLLEDPTPRRKFWYIFSTALLLYTHLFSVFIVAAQNIAWLVQWLRGESQRVPLRQWLVLQGITAATLLPFMPIILFWLRRQSMGFWIDRPNLDSITAAYLDYAGAPLLLCAFSVLIVIGVKRLRSRSALPLAIFLLPVVIPIIVSMIRTPMFISRYGLAAAPGIFVLAAGGLGAIRWPIVSYAIAAVLATISLIALREAPPEDWRGAAAYVDALATPGDYVMINERFSTVPFNYYSNRNDLTVKGFWGGRITLGLPLENDKHAWLIVNRPDVPMQEIIDAGNWRIVRQKAFTGIIAFELADGQTEKLPPERDAERRTAHSDVTRPPSMRDRR
jgi:mannosyltransferase